MNINGKGVMVSGVTGAGVLIVIALILGSIAGQGIATAGLIGCFAGGLSYIFGTAV